MSVSSTAVKPLILTLPRLLLQQNIRPQQRQFASVTTDGGTNNDDNNGDIQDAAASSIEEETETVPITFIDEAAGGAETVVQAKVGDHLLDVAHAHNVELEGACGGELACSTCHLVFPQDIYDQLPPKTEEEEDMLDLALQVTETSRLGCQIPVKKEYVGMKLRIPDDGF